MKLLPFKSLLCLLFFATFLTGLAFQSEAALLKKKKPKPAKTLLIFEKKPCFGFCPVYKATFRKDGKIAVTYRQPGQEEAQKTVSISKEEACDLWKRGEKLGFFQMKPRYDTQKTDWPEREITLFKNGKPKTVVYSEGGTPEFEAYLEDLAAVVENKLNVNFGALGR